MTKYLIEDTTLTNIANAIRGIAGSIEEIKVADMAGEISKLPLGGGLETCTVSFSRVPSGGSNYPFCYQTVENGEVVTKISDTGVTSPITVLCGSMLVLTCDASGASMPTSSGITSCGHMILYGGARELYVFQINLSAGETGTISAPSFKD